MYYVSLVKLAFDALCLVVFGDALQASTSDFSHHADEIYIYIYIYRVLLEDTFYEGVF